jgi:hypothetical protein
LENEGVSQRGKRELKIWSPASREFEPTQPRPFSSPLNDRPLMSFLPGNVRFISGWWRISLSRETHPLRGLSCCPNMRVIMGKE